ncbi:hypothetical protein [Polynucleobacter sp. KF022]|jgi:hypothetical protein|uniref:hypothetical protein n=1 Tax=Polynucleobacter sp. KF022 TaxID=2982615 RepID=UPI002493CA03|nr:hypothetical protein [Polynucleobacter sp. KF022]
MYQIKREMGCSIEDLTRWLPQALGELYSSASLDLNGKVLLQAQNPLVEISGFSRPSRKIALLNIPVLELKLVFAQSLSPSQVEQALNRFDLYTRRGGG